VKGRLLRFLVAMLVVIPSLLAATPHSSLGGEQHGPTPGIVVDASAYVFKIPAPLRDRTRGPKSIPVVSKEGTYSGEWPEQGGRIGVGCSERDGDVVWFCPFWVGMIEVGGGEGE
jgi:hypothetical protein